MDPRPIPNFSKYSLTLNCGLCKFWPAAGGLQRTEVTVLGLAPAAARSGDVITVSVVLDCNVPLELQRDGKWLCVLIAMCMGSCRGRL